MRRIFLVAIAVGSVLCFAFVRARASYRATAVAQSLPQAAAASAGVPNYSIEAIRYATLPHYPLAGFLMGAPRDQFIDAAMVIWLIRGGGRTILFDSGFHRQKYMDQFH